MATQIIRFFTYMIAIRRFGSMFTMGIYSINLHEHGLSLLQMNLVNAIYFGTMLLFELPTGAIADVFGRRKAFLLSSVLIGAGFISYGFSNTMEEFMISEALVAIGATFENGAFKSWLVDRLGHFGHKSEDLNKIFSKAGKIGLGFGAIASIIGPKAASVWAPLPWIISGSIFFLSGIAAYFLMKEEYFVRNTSSLIAKIRDSKRMVCEGFRSAISNRDVLFLFLLGIVSCVSVQALNMQWSILFLEKGGIKENVGNLSALILISLALGTGMAPRIKAQFKNERTALIWTQIGIGLFIVLAATLIRSYFIVPAFLLHEMLRGAYQPMKDSHLHHSIKEKHRRATVSSFESISNHIGAIIGLICSGFLVQSSSIQSTWIVSGLILITGTVLISRTIKK